MLHGLRLCSGREFTWTPQYQQCSTAMRSWAAYAGCGSESARAGLPPSSISPPDAAYSLVCFLNAWISLFWGVSGEWPSGLSARPFIGMSTLSWSTMRRTCSSATIMQRSLASRYPFPGEMNAGSRTRKSLTGGLSPF
jgi:hypothetical protein